MDSQQDSFKRNKALKEDIKKVTIKEGENIDEAESSKIKETIPQDNKGKKGEYVEMWTPKKKKVYKWERTDPRMKGRRSYWNIDPEIEPFIYIPKPPLTKSKKKQQQQKQQSEITDKESRSCGGYIPRKTFRRFKPKVVLPKKTVKSIPLMGYNETLYRGIIFDEDEAEEYIETPEDEFDLTTDEQWDEICECRYIPEEFIKMFSSLPVMKRWVGGSHTLRIHKKTSKSPRKPKLVPKTLTTIQGYDDNFYKGFECPEENFNSKKFNFSDISNENLSMYINCKRLC